MGEMKPYVVRQGDYLQKIAFEQGFDATEVWKHEKNAELRSQGHMPEVLAPGEILFIPDGPRASSPIAVGDQNAFQASVGEIELNLTFRHDDGTPYKEEPYKARHAGREAVGKTTVDGKLNLTVPLTCRYVDFAFDRVGVLFRAEIGHLDPVTTTHGVRQREDNLGLSGSRLAWLMDKAPDSAVSRLISALRDQVADGLPADTEQNLKEAHGV